ncbi:4'-phosphopantetheinyl transferase family protein [Halioxenophilus sp. WMMB6]|uniref:4'-phosphopantetheinyl transferase family protein n=1 Tax=Halioxenophilus sp. WMMB6 TaxID=3073815 RepID=UPI00295E6959|nr:4'-phosphopantetheinyl transferase superfamily protein [Halioxenophilus sp. WMMB6]
MSEHSAKPVASLYLCHYSDWDFAALKQRFYWLLNTEEQERYERFKNLDAQHQFLLGKILTRWFLAKHLDRQPESLLFQQNDHGKPSLVDNAIDFNLSHTQGVVALAITNNGAIGLDVETTQRKSSTLEIADHFFHPSEVTAISAGNTPNDQRQRFFRFWTLKEAYVKAVGQGLQKSLQSFYFALGPQQQVAIADEECDLVGSQVQIYSYRVWSDYLLCWLQLAPLVANGGPQLWQVAPDLTISALEQAPDFFANSVALAAHG